MFTINLLGGGVTSAIYNEDYADTVERLYRAGEKVDVVLTSPPYNTNKKQGARRTLLNTDAGGSHPWVRYDTVQDCMTNDEYCDFLCSFMVDMDCILAEDGVVYDPFMGSGTTLVACRSLGLDGIGSEISALQCDWAARRVMDLGGKSPDGM